MILKQYFLGCLAHASYLIGDESSGRAVVVDPQRDVDQYLEDAEQLGLRLSDVILTHFHADFVSGHLELAARSGAHIHLGRAGTTEYEANPLADGDRLELGQLRLQILETPGHTPESICVVVYEHSASPSPYAVLTGDTLFIGDVGRPDLMLDLGLTPQEMASQLYDSLHDKLLALPDETLVYPAHGSGSFCGRSMSKETVSTIGDQRRTNLALQVEDREQFVRELTGDFPDLPAYFAFDAALNRQSRPTLEQSLDRSLRPMEFDELMRRAEEGAQLLDARGGSRFAREHLVGSLNIGLNGNYASWAGTLLRHDRPILLIAEPGHEREAAMRLGRIGFDNVQGYLVGGIAAARAHPGSTRRAKRISIGTLREEQGSNPGLTVLDVRTHAEHAASQIEGSLHIPLHELPDRLGELRGEREFAVVCAGGYRSSTAASLLRRHGFERVRDLVEGFDGWQREGYPVSLGHTP